MLSACVTLRVQTTITRCRIQIRMMANKYDEENPNEASADVNHRSPMERMLAMKDEQIGVLRRDLARKENQMAQREKETREELSKNEKEMRDMLMKKDKEWMDELQRREQNLVDKIEELKGQVAKRDREVYII